MTICNFYEEFIDKPMICADPLNKTTLSLALVVVGCDHLSMVFEWNNRMVYVACFKIYPKWHNIANVREQFLYHELYLFVLFYRSLHSFSTEGVLVKPYMIGKKDKWRSSTSCPLHPVKVILIVHNNSNLVGVAKLYLKHVLSGLVLWHIHTVSSFKILFHS